MRFLELRQAPGVYSELQRGWPFETRFYSAKSGLQSSYHGHLGKLNYSWQEDTDISGGEPGVHASLISFSQLYWYSYQFS